MHLFYVLLRHTLRDFGAIILFNSHLIHLFFITIRHKYVLTKDLLKNSTTSALWSTLKCLSDIDYYATPVIRIAVLC